MKSDDAESKYRAPALEKGLDILELLSATKTPLTMPMIASELGRSKGEIFRMTAVLEQRGYIRRLPRTESFVITNRLFELGMRNPPIRNLVDTAGPLMHGLARATDQSCLMAVTSGDQIVVIYSAESSGHLSFTVRIGHRQPLLRSTSGILLLAFQESDIQEEWLALEQDPARRTALRRRASSIRSRGYEITPSETIEGIVDICAPLFDGRSPGAIASLLMPLVTHRWRSEEEQQAIQAVRSTASAISEQLSVGFGTRDDPETIEQR